MSSTVFVNGVTLTDAEWFNDTDDVVYGEVAFVNNSTYGAIGDSATDDTTAIQSALNSGKTLVRFNPGSTYIVSVVGQKTILGTAQSYCLLIPDGVTVDLNGATIKLAAGSNAAIFLNSTAGTTQNIDVSIQNGILDGNETNQGSASAGDLPCLFLFDVLRPRVKNIRVKNARQYFGRFLKIDNGYFNNLNGKRSDGDGWSFGISASSCHVTNSYIDNIYAEDCTNLTYGTLQGNGFIATTKYCNIGKVECVNVGGGNKIQDDSQDTTWAQSIFRGGVNASSNGGTKLQGTAGQRNLARITVGRVISENANSEGMHWTESTDCSVGSYVGYLNGVTGNSRDFFIDESERWSVGTIKSTGCGETNGPAVSIGPDNDDYYVASINVHNAANRAVGNAADGYGVIESVNASDDQGSPTLAEAYVVTSTTARGRCEQVRFSRVNAGATQPRAWINCINKQYEIGRIESGSTDLLEGVVQLTNAGNTTSVVCDHITKEFVGTSTTDHYFHPIIEITPWEVTAGALIGTSGFRTVVNRFGTIGTGFDIKHATAGVANFVHWKVLGWKVVSKEQA